MSTPSDMYEYLELSGHKFRIEERIWRGETDFRNAIFAYGDYQPMGSYHKTREAARGEINDFLQHQEQLKTLTRVNVTHLWAGKSSPWGGIDSATQYQEGVVSVGTPGHGGFKLDAASNKQVPAIFRNRGGWYEEDSEWAKVAVGHPALFTDRERAFADKSLKNSYPDEYEAHYGVVLQPGESRNKDERLFHAAHTHDWIAIAAINSDNEPGMVEVIATVGGVRGGDEEKTFMVPSPEYRNRSPFGFVIDPSRHHEKNAVSPSSFLGR